MATEIDAYDGGQEHRIKLGEVETISWRLHALEEPITLSSASVEIEPASGLSAVEVFLDTSTVALQFTPSIVGKYNAVVAMTDSGGDVHLHELVIDVFE